MNTARYFFGVARIALGFVFLWAFVDKLFGLGYSTKAGSGWINGGSPTYGFLSHASGTFAGVYHALQSSVVVQWLFLLGLLGIGLALVAGVGMRIAAATGALLLLMMYGAATVGVAGTSNPIVDSHIIYAIILVGFAYAGAGRTLGFGNWWTSLPYVRDHSILE
ncbi:MAG: hypothetical protein ACYDCK_12230 [Thermoplasmatota archaeon]